MDYLVVEQECRNVFMKTYHICLSSHDEVLYRDEDDFNYGFNCFAVASLETGSRPLCDSFLSTHHHLGVMCDVPKLLIFRSRNAYSRYFNTKYHRRGRFGEKTPFVLELNGARHMTAAFSYILRQALHHGICATPFGYEYCSVNSLFRKEMGRDNQPRLIADKYRCDHLPSHVSVPSNYRMNESGLLLREDVEDVSFMEAFYISPRNFLFQMNRKSGEEWEREQREESQTEPIITLDVIEKGATSQSIDSMLRNENGWFDNRFMSDLELCKLIDKEYVPRYSGDLSSTIYDLSYSQRTSIGNDIFLECKKAIEKRTGSKLTKIASVEQIRRCAIIH